MQNIGGIFFVSIKSLFDWIYRLSISKLIGSKFEIPQWLLLCLPFIRMCFFYMSKTTNYILCIFEVKEYVLHINKTLKQIFSVIRIVSDQTFWQIYRNKKHFLGPWQMTEFFHEFETFIFQSQAFFFGNVCKSIIKLMDVFENWIQSHSHWMAGSIAFHASTAFACEFEVVLTTLLTFFSRC